MLKIYHNTRCGKSRAGLKFLQDKGLEPEIIEYLKTPLTAEEIKHLLMKMNISAFEMIRTQEAVYKSDFKGLNLTEDEWIKVMIEHPKLMKRPIVETKLKAIWAVPAELIDDIL